MPNGRCRMHGGPSPGAPKGNKNALKHGLYTAEAIARRREISALMRAMKALARNNCAWSAKKYRFGRGPCRTASRADPVHAREYQNPQPRRSRRLRLRMLF